jgi:hypothetical protein
MIGEPVTRYGRAFSPPLGEAVGNDYAVRYCARSKSGQWVAQGMQFVRAATPADACAILRRHVLAVHEIPRGSVEVSACDRITLRFDGTMEGDA